MSGPQGIDNGNNAPAEPLSTEDALLNNVPDIPDAASTDQSSAPATEGENNQQASTPAQQTQQQDNQDPSRRIPEGATVNPDGTLTLANGTIEGGGAHRRLYEKAQAISHENNTLRAQAQQVVNENQQLQRELATLRQAASIGTQLGLDAPSQVQALEFMSQYKRDPIGTIRNILAEVAAAGYDISELVGSDIGTNAIQAMLAKELAPIREEQARREAIQRIEQESAQEADAFFQRFPDARQYETELYQILTNQQNPNRPTTPEGAYYALRNFFTSSGLEWGKPLAPQVQALRQQQQQQAQQGATSTQGTVPVTPPNGRGTANGNSTGEPNMPNLQMASANDDFDAIIKRAMAANGMNTGAI